MVVVLVVVGPCVVLVGQVPDAQQAPVQKYVPVAGLHGWTPHGFGQTQLMVQRLLTTVHGVPGPGALPTHFQVQVFTLQGAIVVVVVVVGPAVVVGMFRQGVSAVSLVDRE